MLPECHHAADSSCCHGFHNHHHHLYRVRQTTVRNTQYNLHRTRSQHHQKRQLFGHTHRDSSNRGCHGRSHSDHNHDHERCHLSQQRSPLILTSAVPLGDFSSSGAPPPDIDDAAYEVTLPFQMRMFDHSSEIVWVSSNGVSSFFPFPPHLPTK